MERLVQLEIQGRRVPRGPEVNLEKQGHQEHPELMEILDNQERPVLTDSPEWLDLPDQADLLELKDQRER